MVHVSCLEFHTLAEEEGALDLLTTLITHIQSSLSLLFVSLKTHKYTCSETHLELLLESCVTWHERNCSLNNHSEFSSTNQLPLPQRGGSSRRFLERDAPKWFNEELGSAELKNRICLDEMLVLHMRFCCHLVVSFYNVACSVWCLLSEHR